jgi:RNA polymerase sigma-70 factor (ECF subfamily)
MANQFNFAMKKLLVSGVEEKEGRLLALTAESEAHAEPKLISEEVFLQKIFVQDAKKGCEVLFNRYYTNLCNHALRFVYSKEVAEDIVNEVFAYFWQHQVFEKINTSYRAYLYKAVRYRSYNHIKSELNQIESQQNTPESIPVLQADDILHYNELCHKLDKVIQNLPPQCRKVFQLNRLEGKKYAQVAEELNITVSAVERLISRALAKLRTELKEEWLLDR